jgi:hypothetical protein
VPEGDKQTYIENVPKLRWFNLQREAMANESYLYALLRLAKCECVLQWGFDETSLDGVPTLNQWCRIEEGGEYHVVTIECAGLLPGSASVKIAEHVRLTWERGREALNLLRQELGEEADELVPLVNGGIDFSKLRGVMHDTCNAANKVARVVKELRDDRGKVLYGVEEWEAMEGTPLTLQSYPHPTFTT